LKIEEKRLLEIRQKASEKGIASFNQIFFLMLVVIFALLVTTFLSIRHSFNKRFRAELELKKANDLFSKLFHESPVGMVITRVEDGRIIDCNSEYAELINYSRDQIVGKTAVELELFKSEDQVRELTAAAGDHGTARDIEVFLQPKEKEPIWVSISLQSIQIRDTRCILAALLDMTSHKQAEEKVKKALAKEIELNKMKSNFVTLASHEFRTPLTAILSSAALLEKYALEGNVQRAEKHLERIKFAIHNLTLILDEFLSVSKIEEEKISPMFEKLNLKDYLTAVCLNLKGSAKPAQNIFYDHHGQSLVWTDPTLVRYIVTNLVSNAIKYSDDGTNIIVSSSVNGQILITVKDSGIGIPKEEQKNLFNRFYRASNAGNIQGTGLGLHITKHYVDMLHGSIHVNSEPGKGSEFEVVLDPFEQKEA
jgi:PAS domain S-box-containing protein